MSTGSPTPLSDAELAELLELYSPGGYQAADAGMNRQSQMLYRALAELRSLRPRVEKLEAAVLEEIDNRDKAEKWADDLAYAIAPVSEIGEHSSMNNPWENALEVARSLRPAEGEVVVKLQPEDVEAIGKIVHSGISTSSMGSALSLCVRLVAALDEVKDES